MKDQVKEDVKPFNWMAFGFSVLIVGAMLYQCNRPTPPPTRDEQIEAQFSLFSGAHRGLQRVIKNGLNDPDSYEHISTTYEDYKDFLIVSTKYRAKNVFGGFVVSEVVAKVSLNGNVVEIRN